MLQTCKGHLGISRELWLGVLAVLVVWAYNSVTGLPGFSGCHAWVDLRATRLSWSFWLCRRAGLWVPELPAGFGTGVLGWEMIFWADHLRAPDTKLLEGLLCRGQRIVWDTGHLVFIDVMVVL